MMRHNLCNQLGRLREQPAFRVAGAEKLVRLVYMRAIGAANLGRGRSPGRQTGRRFARAADNNKWSGAGGWVQALSDIVVRRLEVG